MRIGNRSLRRSILAAAWPLRTPTGARKLLVAWCWLGMSWPALSQAAGVCSSPPMESGWHTITVHTGDRDRQVPLYVPASGAGRSQLALVFDLHGSGGSGRQQATHSGLPTQADRHSFLV